MTPNTPPKPAPAPFLTTRWTRVCLAKSNSDDGREALADLCAAYYEPVFAYLRGVFGDREAAQEVSQAFFARMLEGGVIQTADPERGRFRFYLLGAVKHFVAHRREAEARGKRGGGTPAQSLDTQSLQVADRRGATPEEAFDRQWAITVLGRALDALGAECAATGKGPLFDQLRPWLLGESSHGDQTAAAVALGLSAAACKVAIHRMRHRFRQHVKAEIAGTLRDPSAVDDEMRSLLAALGR